MNKAIAMMKDKAFQKVVLAVVGYSLGTAVVMFGIVTVVKWYVGYLMFVKLGGAKLLLKEVTDAQRPRSVL